MDDRTGQLYDSKLAAQLDGVPDQHVSEVDVVEIASGPFKGRKYVRNSNGTLGRRVFDDARSRKP